MSAAFSLLGQRGHVVLPHTSLLSVLGWYLVGHMETVVCVLLGFSGEVFSGLKKTSNCCPQVQVFAGCDRGKGKEGEMSPY